MAGLAVQLERAYSRADARRLLRITERQLRGWERAQLVSPSETYGFRELIALRTIIKLRNNRRPPQQIRRAVHALGNKLNGVVDPLTELRLYADGNRIRVEVDGHAMEAESGQLLLNFDQEELSRLVEFKKPDPDSEQRERRLAAERWFQRGLDLEQTGATAEEIMDAYETAVALDPTSAGALVNLGTLAFNQRKWTKAERYYKRALEADPEYALAHFNLANLYDERGRRELAEQHYARALEIAPAYADAHYNLALLQQGSNRMMEAVRHWNAYLKLDPTSQWAKVARRELEKLRKAAVVHGRGGRKD